MKRRAALTTTATALSLLAGCLSDAPGAPRESDPVATDSSVQSTGGAGDESTAPTSRGPTRGESDADVETRVVESDADVEYLADEHAVRYVARWRNEGRGEDGEPTREPEYETTPFEDWAEIQCVEAAGRAAADHAGAALGASDVGAAISSGVAGEDLAAVVVVETVLDRDGEVVREPAVGFDGLVAATPASVDATYVIADEAYSMDAPVYVRHSVLRQQ
ncbi:hypothetical protein [Halorubellus salinus]|uniref:hypothetical protein n=1 Tax=Halorubellus salinus TaxID=755309 RepID=UPI001D05F305|nr:hypothetical protein [Halorubellus salinus]